MLTKTANTLRELRRVSQTSSKNSRSRSISQAGNSTPFCAWPVVACVRVTSCRAYSTSRSPSCPPAPTAPKRARFRAIWTLRATSPHPKREIAGKVLLVDDLADSGHTLRAVIDSLRNNYAPITELRSARDLDEGRVDLRSGLFRGIPSDQPLDSPAFREL
jgi:hypothetical protein